jgi:hypothetical protein
MNIVSNSATTLRPTVAPLSVLSDISPSRGEIGAPPFAAKYQYCNLAKLTLPSISPLEGEMSLSDREGCPRAPNNVGAL